MLLNYTTENLKKVVDLFQQQKIACLDIRKNEVMSYFLISDLQEDVQDRVLKLQADSLESHLGMLKALNEIYTNHLAGNEADSLFVHYDVTKEKASFSYQYSFKHKIETDYEKNKILGDMVNKLIEQLTLTGVGNSEIPNLLKKEKDARKKTKTAPVTVAEVLLLIKDMVS